MLTRNAEDRSPTPLVKEVRLHCPERLPSTDCPQGPLSRSRFAGTRHRYLGFAAFDPASDALSPPRCSRAEWLDPTPSPKLFASGRVTGPTSPVDFCNQLRSPSTTDGLSEPRAPRPRSPASEAVFRTAPPRGKSGRSAGGRAAMGTANRDVTGQGPVRSSVSALLGLGSFRRDRSRRKLCPNPIGSNTSCREYVATSAGVTAAAGPSMYRGPLTNSPGNVPRGGACLVGPRLAFPREGERDRPHPRCLPSSDHPVRGASVVPSLSPGCGLWTLRLFDPRHRRARDADT